MRRQGVCEWRCSYIHIVATEINQSATLCRATHPVGRHFPPESTSGFARITSTSDMLFTRPTLTANRPSAKLTMIMVIITTVLMTIVFVMSCIDRDLVYAGLKTR